MALLPKVLESSLERDWLASEGGSHPGSPAESAERFAGAVAGWFGAAQAAGVPCATASARRPQLAAQAAAAIAAQSAVGAADQLTLAVAAYMAGQAFGAGIAAFPLGVAVAKVMVASVFLDVDQPVAARAGTLAGAFTLLASTTLVVFPVPLPPAPVT